jgi:hypothetical protein
MRTDTIIIKADRRKKEKRALNQVDPHPGNVAKKKFSERIEGARSSVTTVNPSTNSIVRASILKGTQGQYAFNRNNPQSTPVKIVATAHATQCLSILEV